MNLERVIRDYIQLQSSLLDSFKVSYPEASDYRWLLDFPKAVSIVVGNDVWVFKKHGAGLKFSEKRGHEKRGQIYFWPWQWLNK